MADLLERRGDDKGADGVTFREKAVAALWSKAADGDVAAMRVILEYLVGKPGIMSRPDSEGAYKMYVTVSPDDWPDRED